MSAPAGSALTKRGRYYVDTATGAKYPSVTTVIDRALSKPALTGWYAKTTATRAVDELAELSRRVRLDGPEDAVKWLTAAPREAASAAAVRGSDLHDLAERHGRGEQIPDHLHPDVSAMVAQYETFLTDFRPTIVRTEMTVLNRTLGYGGTADAVMTMAAYDHRPLVVDYKTGRTGPWAEWAIQLAAYSRGEHVLQRNGKTITQTPMVPVEHDTALILRIRPDRYELHEADLTGLHEVFAAMVRVHAFTERTTPFTRRLPDTANPQHWAALVAAAGTIEDLQQVWVEAVAAGVWDDHLLALCRTRKTQIITDAA